MQPDSGEVVFDGKVINGVPPHKRQLNTIFQRYALFPHLNVYENIAFGLRLQKKSEKEIKESVTAMLELVNRLKLFSISLSRPSSLINLSSQQLQRLKV